jgi:hypothetical protein
MWRLIGLAYVGLGAWLLSGGMTRRRRDRWHMHECPCGNAWAHQASGHWTHDDAIRAHTCNMCNTEVWEAKPIPQGSN